MLVPVLGKPPVMVTRHLAREQQGLLASRSVSRLILCPAEWPLLARRHLVGEQRGLLTPGLVLELVLRLAEVPLLERRHKARERASSSFLARPIPRPSLSSFLASTPATATILLPASAFLVTAEVEKAD